MRKTFLSADMGALFLAAVLAIGVTATADAKGRKQQTEQGQQGDEQGEKKEAKQEYETPFPTKMNWILSSINGKAPVAEATLQIDENLRGAGLSGCNSWSAALYPQRGHKLAMGPVAMTKKVCGAAETAQERAFLTILATRPDWDQQGSVLTIKSKYGVLVFNRGI